MDLGDISMKYMTLILLAIILVVGCAVKQITQEDIQQLEEAKSLL